MDNREAWLEKGIAALRPVFKAHGHDVPDNVRATCGFPSRGATSARKRTVGQCWDSAASDGAVFETLVSPVLADSVEVLAVLAHELVHATVGLKAGHKGAFKRCATDIGLEGKMTATTAGDAFKQSAATIIASIGEYPHKQLNPSVGVKKQSTRLIKCQCELCGYTVRVAQTWITEVGAPICPADEIAMAVA